MTGSVQIKRFNFTYAIQGGAWVEFADGLKEWIPFSVLDKYQGKEWVERQIKRQGMFTGCWIDVD